MKFSKECNELIASGIGYRNNNVGSGGSSSILSVLEFEYRELGNEDIPDTLKSQGLIGKATYKKAVQFFTELQAARGTKLYAMWFCASIDNVNTNYPDYEDDSADSSYEEDEAIWQENQATNDGYKSYADSIDTYELPSFYIIASDLGDQGILVVSDVRLSECYVETIYHE
jgi:hypothetical protein